MKSSEPFVQSQCAQAFTRTSYTFRLWSSLSVALFEIDSSVSHPYPLLFIIILSRTFHPRSRRDRPASIATASIDENHIVIENDIIINCSCYWINATLFRQSYHLAFIIATRILVLTFFNVGPLIKRLKLHVSETRNKTLHEEKWNQRIHYNRF